MKAEAYNGRNVVINDVASYFKNDTRYLLA